MNRMATPTNNTSPCPGLNSATCTSPPAHPSGTMGTTTQPHGHSTHVATTAFVVSCVAVLLIGAIYTWVRNARTGRISIMPNGMIRRPYSMDPYDAALAMTRPSRRQKHPVLTDDEINDMAPIFALDANDTTTRLKPDIVIAKSDPALIKSKDFASDGTSKNDTLVGVKAVERMDPDGDCVETENVENLCAICVSAVNDSEPARKISQCGHVFHASCVEKWLKLYQACCPLCKLVLKERVGEEASGAVRPGNETQSPV